MPRPHLRSALLVLVQFVAGFCILYPSPFAGSALPIAMQVLSIVLIGWSVLTMRLGNLHVLPDVNANATLVTHGPYRWLRHPMYTAVLIYTLAAVIDSASTFKFVAWGILLIDLIVKLRYEEKLLAQRFETYAAYRTNTWRLIPWVW